MYTYFKILFKSEEGDPFQFQEIQVNREVIWVIQIIQGILQVNDLHCMTLLRLENFQFLEREITRSEILCDSTGSLLKKLNEITK